MVRPFLPFQVCFEEDSLKTVLDGIRILEKIALSLKERFKLFEYVPNGQFELKKIIDIGNIPAQALILFVFADTFQVAWEGKFETGATLPMS